MLRGVSWTACSKLILGHAYGVSCPACSKRVFGPYILGHSKTLISFIPPLPASLCS